ncbi:MAG: hypothetical protein OEV85_02620 [Candidatus Thorarchaeota archaeon]|nr:hypothetical protein [Candidatus Thorarchaeota archaeon]
MINQIVELAKELSNERRKDPELVSRMELAAHGQFPRFLLISPIDRSSQDLQLFDMVMGDAFHGTRVPRMPLYPPDKAPFLFGGPAAYNRGFSNERGVILTFELDEPEAIIKDTLDNLVLHPDVKGIPILVFRVDYELGRARIIPHGKGRNYEAENYLLGHLRKPDKVDTDTLVLICSDSRVHPPETPSGLPMAILTLAGYIPRYTGSDDETHQLNEFFSEWLSTSSSSKHILIVAHGNFEGEGHSCGAAQESLDPTNVKNSFLRYVVSELQLVATQYENHILKSAEERAKTISLSIREHLISYPAVKEFADTNPSDFIDILLMDTISNTLTNADI